MTPGLLDVPVPELIALADAVRADAHGGRVTFSPAVLVSPFLTPDEVLAIARAGAAAGCHEALFTLGGAEPGSAERGHAPPVDQLVALCRLVLDETGLLPHVMVGALGSAELERLRAVSPSLGMMIHSPRTELVTRRVAPEQDLARRLATLDAAGRLDIPLTTGIFVGGGETVVDRLPALAAIAESHHRYGHVQQVIVQDVPAETCPSYVRLRAIALARLVLPPDVHVQAPPNLAAPGRLGDLLAAGVDDWGSVSPGPATATLREATEAAGRTLAPRLAVHPRYALDPDRWLHEGLRFAVQDRSDAAGLARDDPGATWPERHQAAANVGTGAEVVQVGRRSTAWYSGADAVPPVLVPAPALVAGPVAEVLAGVRAGQGPGETELVTLFGARGPEVAAVAALADELRAEATGDTVTYVVNRNINYTNVCTYRCTFCGFSKGPLSLNLRGKPYLLTLGEVAARAAEAWELGATEVCLQGGIHPSFDGDFYVDVTAAVAEAVPAMHIHGFTALEVTEGARRLGEPLTAYLRRLRDAGLRSLPGTAAEILDDEVRAVLCPDKIDTQEWLDAHRAAHSLGLRSNVTIMFGSVERPVHWARHLVRTRELQRETGGFTEFVALPFVHMAAPIYLKRAARRGPTWREVVLMHAVARIAYRGLIDNIQASWVKLGPAGAGQLLQAGVNDLGGTLMDENISRAAGATHGQGLDEAGFRLIAAAAGRTLVQRTTLYGRPTSLRS